MKWTLAIALLASLSGNALAQDKFMCCDLNAGETSAACIGQASACARSGDFSVQLSDTVPRADGAWAPGSDATIPGGQDGYIYWSTALPHAGFCFVAPVAGDPNHDVQGLDPIGCLRVTLNPGVSAEMLDVLVPDDPRWDGYQWCYGAPDPLTGCQTVADGVELTVSPTPSGSCCTDALPMMSTSSGKLNFGTNELIPGVPPPTIVIQRGRDGGLIVPYYNADPPDADIIVSSADAGCLAAYDEPPTCGAKPDGSAAPGPLMGKDDAAVLAPVVMNPAAVTPVGCSVGGGPGGLFALGLVLVALRRARRA